MTRADIYSYMKRVYESVMKQAFCELRTLLGGKLHKLCDNECWMAFFIT